MKNNCMLKWLAVFLLSITVIAGYMVPVRADDSISEEKTGSIRVTLRNSKKEVVSGGEICLYQVASIEQDVDGNLKYIYINGFESCGIKLENLDDSNLAKQLEAKISPSSKKVTKTIGTTGTVVFENLPTGLYLLKQNQAAKGYEKISSFLVSVPMKDGENWTYDVDATPKVETVTPITPDTPNHPNTPNNPWGSGGSGGSGEGSHSSRLPQTGQLDWPIPVLAISGMLMIVIGWALRKGKNK